MSLEGTENLLDVHFDKNNKVIISQHWGMAHSRRENIRGFLSSIQGDMPDQIKWLTDFRSVNISEVNYQSITNAFEFRRSFCGTCPSIHCFLHSKSNDMLIVGIMNQIVNMAEATIPNAKAVLSTSVDDALSIVGIADPDPETLSLLNATEFTT